MKVRAGLLFFVAALAISCKQGTIQTEKILDFRGMINQQVDQLNSQHRHLTKSASLDQNLSDSTFVPTRGDWIRELEILS